MGIFNLRKSAPSVDENVFLQKRFSRRGAERQREERLTGTVRPTSVRVSEVMGIGGLEGIPRPTGFGGFQISGFGRSEWARAGMLPLLWEGTLWVGMSVHDHPRPIERLVGYGNRGWLNPPPPEEGFWKGWCVRAMAWSWGMQARARMVRLLRLGRMTAKGEEWLEFWGHSREIGFGS